MPIDMEATLTIPAPTFSIRPLEEVLDYENDAIVYKFQESYDLPFEEAKDLFQETLKWLWLCATSEKEEAEGLNPPHLFVDTPLYFLDEMWHCFILFTKPYIAFCEKYLGLYIHHAPTTKWEKDRIKKEIEEDQEGALKKREEELEVQYNYIYDKLGEETLVKWYSDYTDKYTLDYLNSIRKPLSMG